VVAEASGAAVTALVAVIAALNLQLEQLTSQLQGHVELHPDAEIVRRLPGLGVLLGARVVAEFSDDRTRSRHPKAHKRYAGTAPTTRASGNARSWWPGWPATGGWLILLSVGVLGPAGLARARGYYDHCRAAGQTHPQALRALANRLVGILHGCLHHRSPYNESLAWPGRPPSSTPLDRLTPWGV
jgi:hypothetical protein